MLHLYLNSTCIPSFQHTFNLVFDTHSESRSHRKEPVSGNAGLVYTWIGNNFIPGVPLCLSEPSSGKTGNSIRVWDVSTARFTKNTAEETSLFPRDLSVSPPLFLCIVRALCENEGIKACSLLTMPSSHDQVNGSWREIFYPLLYTRFAEISVFQFFFFSPLFLFLYCVPRLSINAIVSIL